MAIRATNTNLIGIEIGTFIYLRIIWNLFDNMESVFPPGFWKGMCHTMATEADKNMKELSMITGCVIPNFFSIFSLKHIFMLLKNSFSCTSTHGGGSYS